MIRLAITALTRRRSAAFARYDLERTMTLIDSFSRPEMRILLRLNLIQNTGNTVDSLPLQGRSFGGLRRRY